MRKLFMLVMTTGIGYLPFLPVPTPHANQLQDNSKTVASVQISKAIVKIAEPTRKIYPAIGTASSEAVTSAVEFYQSKNLTNDGVAYIVGNFIGESGLRPDAVGDNGLALGIAQWHPGRRVGLPSDLNGQLSYAYAEIQHYPLASALHGSNQWLIKNGIRQYEGYSVEGNRFIYADQLRQYLQ